MIFRGVEIWYTKTARQNIPVRAVLVFSIMACFAGLLRKEEESMTEKRGVIHGRFQCLHNKHMEYLLLAKSRCQTLIIGISNPDVSYIRPSENDRDRSKKENNPFTYFERYEMIRDAMLEYGVPREEFEIVPFPINKPEYISQYAPTDAIYYMSICDAWGQEKYDTLTGLGLRVEVLWKRKPEEKGTTGTEVRKLIMEGKPWDHLVPKSVHKYITKNRLDERIIRLSNG